MGNFVGSGIGNGWKVINTFKRSCPELFHWTALYSHISCRWSTVILIGCSKATWRPAFNPSWELGLRIWCALFRGWWSFSRRNLPLCYMLWVPYEVHSSWIFVVLLFGFLVQRAALFISCFSCNFCDSQCISNKTSLLQTIFNCASCHLACASSLKFYRAQWGWGDTH